METLTFLMTTTYYPPYCYGGDCNHVKNLAVELTNRGHEVHVLYSMDSYNYKKRYFGEKELSNDNLNSRGVHLHPIKSSLGVNDIYLAYLTGNSVCVNNRFNEIVKRVKPDVVHHHNIFLLGYSLLKKKSEYTNLYTAHDYALICQRYDLMKFGTTECKNKLCFFCALQSKKIPQFWRSTKDFKRAIENIDTIIAPSNYLKDKLAEWLPVKVNVQHIPNFILPPPANIKDSGYSDYFLYAGVLGRHKGICNLLKLFKDYNKEIDANLIIVGKGALDEKIKKYIAKNELKNKVLFLGWVSDEMKWSLYKDALALVVPSIWPENNPLVSLEAFSVGTPVIGSDQGGIPEIIEKVDKNLIFKNNDQEAIRIILKDFDRKKYSSIKIKNITDEWYSVDKYFSQYLN